MPQILDEKIVKMLDDAFVIESKCDQEYDQGYRDALEAFALALGNTIPEGLLFDALQTALDAFANNT